MSTKSKSAVSETPNAKISPATPNAKVSPATPRVSKFSRVAKPDADSASPLQNPRLSVDRSPRSVPSRLTTTSGRSPKVATPPEKKVTPTSTRISKPSELQAEINQAHEDLKNAKEKLCAAEKEKEKALDELKEAQKLAEEANEKLREALEAQKRAEEDSEIEKFRAVEMEQAGIEAVQKKDDEWQKELESVRNQHAVDVAALLSANEEIQKAKQELAMTSDAKDQALRHAEDVTKIAEAHAEKIETLSAELVHLKSVLDSIDETEANENSKLVSELELEMVFLRQELEKAKSLEDKLAEKEVSIEQMNVDLEAAKMAESYARNLMGELHEQVEELGFQAQQAKRLERSTSESLESIMKQLEISNDSLHDAESEIASLKEKVGLLEISIKRQRKDFEETERSLEQAKDEASEMAKCVESLKAELETVKEEKTQSLNNEKLAAASVIDLLEEKNKLINELGISRDREEQTKQALENLTPALNKVSSEARDAKEKLLSVQAERENYENQIEDLKHVLQATNEKYESMLDDTNLEINSLMSSIEQSKHYHESSKNEWEQKELHLMNAVKKSEEENLSAEKEINRLVNLLKNTEDEVSSTRDEGDSWKSSFKEVESEVIYLKEVLSEAKAESIKLKEGLMNKENELQNILQENEELRKIEESSQKKVEELTKLLEEKKEASLAKKHLEEDGDDENNKTDSEKDYDMLPKVVEFSEQNGTTGDVTKTNDDQKILVEKSNGKIKENENEKDNTDSVEVVDLKMWESCKIEEKDLLPEGESFGDEHIDESKGDRVESFDQVSVNENVDNGGSSPSKQLSQKKKKPLLRKFGNLLKKKGTSTNQK